MDQPKTSNRARLRMAGRLRLPDARRLADQLDTLLGSRPIEVDLTGLEETDAAVLQVLAVARRQAASRSQDLFFRLPERGSVADLIAQLALGPHLSTEGAAAPENKEAGTADDQDNSHR